MADTAMKKLPGAELYDETWRYWPYKRSLKMVPDIITERSGRGAYLMDAMCGPGWLLSQIAKRRADMSLTGLDIDQRYVHHGRRAYPDISFERGDILRWKAPKRYDVVTCTGALHHLMYLHQDAGVEALAAMLAPGGMAVISDCYISDYRNETERRLAALKLGYEYLKATIRNEAPARVVEKTNDLVHNDLLMHEFKTSLRIRLPVLKRHFKRVSTIKAWPPQKTEYGDYIHICSN